MSGVATAVVAAAAIGAGVSAYSGHQASKAAKSAGARIGALEYEEDPNYSETQAALKKLGLGLLEGDVPEYYKSIGEYGGGDLEKIIGMTTRDIEKSAAESMAASGRSRGGALAPVTAQSIADTALKLRYSDFERSLAGKQYLLNTGIGTTEGVRTAATGVQSEKNQLNVNKAGALNELDFAKADANSQEVAGYGAALTSIIDGLWGTGGLLGKKTTTTGTTNQTGVSDLGAISKRYSSSELNDILASIRK